MSGLGPTASLFAALELGPAVCVAHLGLSDVRERVSGLDRIGLLLRVVLTAFATALVRDLLGLGLRVRGDIALTCHVAPPLSIGTAYRAPDSQASGFRMRSGKRAVFLSA